MLMERNHRLVGVRAWATARRHTLDDLVVVALRDTDLADDRLANVLAMLSAPADQAMLAQALLANRIRVYRLPHQTTRRPSACWVFQHITPLTPT
jgi:hypothetical protein